MITVSAQEDRAGIAGQPEGPGGEVGRDDDVVDALGADMLGLGAHLLHQPGALDHVGEARIVLHIGGDGELAARLKAGDQHRFEHGARGIDGGGVAGGAGADNGAADGTGLGHGGLSDAAARGHESWRYYVAIRAPG